MQFSPGALHMHTTYSDGTGSVEELARAAREAGLQWIIITDHNTLEAHPQQGWIGGVLVIVGQEVTPDRNHFLALNLDTVIDHSLAPQAFIDETYARGGFGIIAHPDERVQNDFKDIYRWDDWNVDGPTDRANRTIGIELWNVMSDWAERLTQRNKVPLVLAPQLGLTGPTPDTLAWWDRLNVAGKRTFGVGGVDAHAFKRKAPWGEVTVLSYKWIFGTATNYLLLDEPLATDAATATQQVYAALAAGRSYMVNRIDGACKQLDFHAARGEERARPGDTIGSAGGPLTFAADTGQNADVRLIRDGAVVARGVRAIRHTTATPGVYRLEAYRRARAWIITNPIYVVPDASE